MKHIILCADDYGQNSAISQGIVTLIKRNRITATSCLANISGWKEQASLLNPFKNQIDIGLHFNLTLGKSLTGLDVMPLPTLIIKASLRRLSLTAITAELNAQIDSFIQEMGQPPHFMDGHQHVHQLPIVRDALLDVYARRLREHGTYVRSTFVANSFLHGSDVGYIKQNIIQLCGAGAFKKMLVAQQVPHNTSFAGIYDFKKSARYPRLFIRMLRQIQDGGLIMCHPGLGSSKHDEHSGARPVELQYFNSEEFITACTQENIQLTRFKD